MRDVGAEPAASLLRSRSVRFRLLAIALLPTLVILPLVLAIAAGRWTEKFDETLISKVNGDLTIARQYLRQILANTENRLVALGASTRFREAVAAGNDLAAFLDRERQDLGLDFLHIVEGDGRIPVAAPGGSGATPRADWPIIETARAGTPMTGIDVFPEEYLAALSPDLAARSRLELVPTTNAVPSDRTVETRGMVIQSAAPVPWPGREGVVLVGGILLNQNLVFIDTINDLVYVPESLPEGSRGTATLFLDDVRISTNVRLFEDRRALGTRVSAAVREAVLERGETWRDSAFVVNDWYISAYEPIVDSFGNRAGMLYVGFLEAPFSETRRETLLTIALAFLVITGVSIPVFLGWARGIFRPLERVTRTIASVEAGDLSARTGIRDAGDEIGRVAVHLDGLLERLHQRDRELRTWNEELNRRVVERTRDLELANRQLEATTKQLIMSEKLAAIGEITAGVAHEINNPIAVMQGNLEVLRGAIGDRAELVATELHLLDDQILRISQIVTKLLQFARPEEYADYVEIHAPDALIADCLPLVQHLLHRGDIAIVREGGATRRITMNRTEFQQVLVNLIVNAIHAMPDGGRLTIESADADADGRPGVLIRATDTGVGMTPEVLARVFDPFFTTKRQQGTGLGLSITHTLVTRQGGTLAAVSKPGEGTAFTIWLPAAE